MDLLIFSTQTSFLIMFWIGYFIFIKTILPLISMELKVKQKIILSNLKWLKANVSKIVFFRLPHSKLLIKTRGMLLASEPLLSKKKVFFGLYNMDLLLIKQKIQK